MFAAVGTKYTNPFTESIVPESSIRESGVPALSHISCKYVVTRQATGSIVKTGMTNLVKLGSLLAGTY